MQEEDVVWPAGMEPEVGATVIHNGATRVWRGRDGLIYDQVLATRTIELRDMELLVASIRKLAGERPAVVVAYTGPLRAVTREARNHFASPAGCAAVAALAVVVSSPVVRVMANVFLRWSAPPYPTRMFTSLDDARTWARQLR